MVATEATQLRFQVCRQFNWLLRADKAGLADDLKTTHGAEVHQVQAISEVQTNGKVPVVEQAMVLRAPTVLTSQGVEVTGVAVPQV
jgi:predicted Rdx family selenoprotein